jgi:hypothetical protein
MNECTDSIGSVWAIPVQIDPRNGSVAACPKKIIRPQALLLYRAHEETGESIQIRRSRRRADDFDGAFASVRTSDSRRFLLRDQIPRRVPLLSLIRPH